ncbi:hypothetical protein SNE40_022595 [Patella caerulea]|uniref:Uncharacterized protein n=1 Tax=Patella caerulea TaxID=87958 RepID=A0AAN8G4E0_PATCE
MYYVEVKAYPEELEYLWISIETAVVIALFPQTVGTPLAIIVIPDGAMASLSIGKSFGTGVYRCDCDGSLGDESVMICSQVCDSHTFQMVVVEMTAKESTAHPGMLSNF